MAIVSLPDGGMADVILGAGDTGVVVAGDTFHGDVTTQPPASAGAGVDDVGLQVDGAIVANTTFPKVSIGVLDEIGDPTVSQGDFVTIGATGVLGLSKLVLEGNGSVFGPAGEITLFAGIRIEGRGAAFGNSGSIAVANATGAVVVVVGDGARGTNSGVVDAPVGQGIELRGDDTVLTNTRTVTAAGIALAAVGDGVSITNGASGTATGGDVGIKATGDGALVINEGAADGDTHALSAEGNGNEVVSSGVATGQTGIILSLADLLEFADGGSQATNTGTITATRTGMISCSVDGSVLLNDTGGEVYAVREGLLLFCNGGRAENRGLVVVEGGGLANLPFGLIGDGEENTLINSGTIDTDTGMRLSRTGGARTTPGRSSPVPSEWTLQPRA